MTTIEENKTDNKNGMSSQTKAIIFLFSVGGLLLLFLIITIIVSKFTNNWKSIGWLLNGDQPFTFKALMLGMFSSMAFGFIDNAGLFFGMDVLSKYLPGKNDELVRAGWGNTFSDGVGAFLGAFIGKIVTMSSGFQGGPVYADFVGIVIGCIMGIYIPKYIMYLIQKNKTNNDKK